MKRPLTDEDLHERASIDGRVAFSVSAFALGAGLVALLDRVGVPEAIVGVLGPILAISGLALIGILMNAMRVSRFYAAGRAVPASYAGLASVALMIGVVLPFLPPASGGARLHGLAAGLAAGFVLTALVTGPLLRKTGAFSLADLVSARFPHLGVRLGVVTVAAAASLCVALAGLETAVRTFEVAMSMNRIPAVILAGMVVILVAAPGGLSGVVWGATAAAAALIAGLVLPLIIILYSGDPLPLPSFGDRQAWDSAQALIESWHNTGAQPGSGSGTVVLALAIALGVSSLAPLLGPSMTVRDAGAARSAGLSSLWWSAVALAIIGVTMAVAAMVAAQWLNGARPDRLPAVAYSASASGLLKICGRNVENAQQALEACKQATGTAGLVLRAGDYTPSGLWLVLGMPELRQFGVAFSGLVSAGGIAIALMLSSAGFLSLGTSLGHDALYRVRNSAARTSARLAMTRMAVIVSVLASLALLARYETDPQKLLGVAIVMSAAAIAPLLVLSLWPRASGTDAAIALLCGLGMAGGVIALGGRAPDVPALATAGVISCIAAVIAGFATSFLHSGGLATEGSVFVHGVLHGESDVLNIEKGI